MGEEIRDEDPIDLKEILGPRCLFAGIGLVELVLNRQASV